MKVKYRFVHSCGLLEEYGCEAEDFKLLPWPHCAEGGVSPEGKNCEVKIEIEEDLT